MNQITTTRRAPSGFAIEQAMSVALAVKQRLLQHDPDLAADETAMRDTLEGESDVFDVLRRLVRFALEAEAQAAVAKQRADNLLARKKRFEAREQYARQAIFGMMEALGEKRFDDPEFTATIKAGAASVFITDEEALPDRFVKTERSPIKSDIAKALKAGEDVPGAFLANAMPTLQIKAT